jgi:DNA-binding transcriptional regulator YiaG
MKTEECSNCGSVASVVRSSYRFDEMGLPLVLDGIEIVKCPTCGNEDPIIPNLDELMHEIALGTIACDRKLCGIEVRFLRKYVGKTQREFAQLIHMDHTHLCNVETGRENIGDQSDKLIRLVVLNLSPDLRDKIDEFMAALPDMEDTPCSGKPLIHFNTSTRELQYA